MEPLKEFINEVIKMGVHVILEDTGLEYNAPIDQIEPFDFPTAIAEENQIERLMARV